MGRPFDRHRDEGRRVSLWRWSWRGEVLPVSPDLSLVASELVGLRGVAVAGADVSPSGFRGLGFSTRLIGVVGGLFECVEGIGVEAVDDDCVAFHEVELG